MSPKSRRNAFLVAACVSGAVMGCRQDMHDQHKIQPLEKSPFFIDGRGSRPPVEGTIARGRLQEDHHYYEGRCDGEPSHDRAASDPKPPAPLEPCSTFPMPVTKDVLLRGQERFNIYCTPCHSRTGDGDGMVVRRGFQHPPSLHSDEAREAKVGQIFEIISKGLGVMPSYAVQIPVADRWAIVAYVRALQLSRATPIEDVAEPHKSELLATRAAAKKGAAQ